MDENILKYIATKQDLDDMRGEFSHSFDVVLTHLDEISLVVKRMDQERVFTFEYVKRLAADVDKNHRDIDRIKDILRIS